MSMIASKRYLILNPGNSRRSKLKCSLNILFTFLLSHRSRCWWRKMRRWKPWGKWVLRLHFMESKQTSSTTSIWNARGATQCYACSWRRSADYEKKKTKNWDLWNGRCAKWQEELNCSNQNKKMNKRCNHGANMSKQMMSIFTLCSLNCSLCSLNPLNCLLGSLILLPKFMNIRMGPQNVIDFASSQMLWFSWTIIVRLNCMSQMNDYWSLTNPKCY